MLWLAAAAVTAGERQAVARDCSHFRGAVQEWTLTGLGRGGFEGGQHSQFTMLLQGGRQSLVPNR